MRPFARDGAIQLRDASGIAYAGVHLGRVVTESLAQRMKDAAYETGCRIIVGEVDPIQQVSAVAAVGVDRCGPVGVCQRITDTPGPIMRGLVFGVGGVGVRLHSLWPDAVNVNEKPSPAAHVLICSTSEPD